MSDVAGGGRFEACLDEVLAQEGGYVDNPKDPGGATNLGITRKTLARWRKVSPWWDLPKAQVKALSRAEAADIYRASFWDRCKAGGLPVGLDLAVFDFAVNSGPDRAIRSLQAELKVKVDGQVGPLTLAALRERVKAAGAGALIEALSARRMGFLKGLATFATFGKGWTRRVAMIRTAALAAAGLTGTTSINQWRVSLEFLAGYKTYIVAAAILIAGLAQLLGIDLPAMDSQSGLQMILEGLGIAFLRKGLKTEIGNA